MHIPSTLLPALLIFLYPFTSIANETRNIAFDANEPSANASPQLHKKQTRHLSSAPQVISRIHRRGQSPDVADTWQGLSHGDARRKRSASPNDVDRRGTKSVNWPWLFGQVGIRPALAPEDSQVGLKLKDYTGLMAFYNEAGTQTTKWGEVIKAISKNPKLEEYLQPSRAEWKKWDAWRDIASDRLNN